MPSVLVVEDDPDVREFMQLLLESGGYSTSGAANGVEAFERLREERPCAILLDIQMPVMDGYQFRARQLREPQFADIPVLCVSAIFDPAEVMQRAGMHCLAKPVEFETLLQHVADMCGQQ